MENDALLAHRLLAEVQYATLATAASDGTPWNSPVFHAYENGKFYWCSTIKAQHSQNIAANGKVFIVIYDSSGKSETDGHGLYTRAAAETLTDQNEILHALELLGAKRQKPFAHVQKFLPGRQQTVFCATVQEAWLNEADRDADGDFIRDFRESIELA